MSYTLTINGTERAYTPGTLSIESETGARKSASVELIDRTGLVDYAALMGTIVTVVNDTDSSVEFAGVLSEYDWETILGTEAIAWSLGFAGYEAICDHVLIFDYYDSASYTLTSDVVAAIITDYLAAYGISAGTIESGSSISEITFNGQSATEALNDLAKRDGFIWWIDESKALQYMAQTSYAAPWNIGYHGITVVAVVGSAILPAVAAPDGVTPNEGHYIMLGGSGSLDNYANTIYQRGPEAGISDLRTESQVGDGARTEFKLTYRAHSNVSVTVNAAAKTIGIKGVDSGKDFYWSQGDDLIYQDEGGSVLGAGDTLAVTYRGQVSLFVKIEDKVEIAARAAAESTSGIYEALFEDSSAIYLDLNVSAAETHLRQMPFSRADLTYKTDIGGLRAGMLQHIEHTNRGVDDDFLITSISADEQLDYTSESDKYNLRYTVSCVNGEKADDWLEYWRKIAGVKDYSLRDNETVQICNKLAATVTMSSVCSVSSAPSMVWNTNLWDDGCAFW
jgi:hypothetical protein